MDSNEYNLLGQAVHVKANLYVIHSKAFVGVNYVLNCPKCGKHLYSVPEKEGICKVRCEDCNVVIGYTAKQELLDAQSVTIPSFLTGESCDKGMLQWGNWPNRKEYLLHTGDNIIGRKDSGNPCDVEIEDPYVSRRSVNIYVRNEESGSYTVFLTVNKTTNPLFLNGHQLSIGESIQIKFGDVITIGKTVIKFKKSKK